MENKPKPALWRYIVFGFVIGYQLLGIILSIPDIIATDFTGLSTLSLIITFSLPIIVYLTFDIFLYFMLFKWTIKKPQPKSI